MRRTVSTMALALIAAAGVAAVATSCGSDSTAPKNKLYVANLIAANEGSGRTSPGSGVATFIDLGTEIDSLRVLFNNGNAYVNVHTSADPGGEIRDQIRPVQ